MEGRALWQLGRLLVHQGHYKDGIKLKREGMKLMEVVLGADHMDIANCCTGGSGSVCYTLLVLAMIHFGAPILTSYLMQAWRGRAAPSMRTQKLKTTTAAHTVYSQMHSAKSIRLCWTPWPSTRAC